MLKSIKDFISPKPNKYQVSLSKDAVINRLTINKASYLAAKDISVNFLSQTSFILRLKGGFMLRGSGNISKLACEIISSNDDITLIQATKKPTFSTYAAFWIFLSLAAAAAVINIANFKIDGFPWAFLPLLAAPFLIILICSASGAALQERLESILSAT